MNEHKLSIQNGNKFIIKCEILREQRKEKLQALSTLYIYGIINLKQTMKLQEKIIKIYQKERLNMTKE